MIGAGPTKSRAVKGSSDGRASASVGCRTRARRAQAPTGCRLLRALVRLRGVDHRRRLALQRPLCVFARRTRRDHLLVARRRSGDASRPYVRGAWWHVPGGRWQRAVPAVRVRRSDRLHQRVGRVPRLRHRCPDHGRGDAALRVELRLLDHHRLGRPAGADRPGLCRRGDPAARLLHDQRHGRAVARRNQHARRLVEALDPGRDSRRAHREFIPPRELHRSRWVHAVRVERRVPRPLLRRRHLRVPRFRAGCPARRRDAQPEAKHPARDHRRHDRRNRPLHRAPARVHPGARPVEPLGTDGAPSRSPERGLTSDHSPHSRRASAWDGSQSCSTPTRSFHPAAPASSTPGQAPVSPSRSLETALSRRPSLVSHSAGHPSSQLRSPSSVAWSSSSRSQAGSSSSASSRRRP